jgi:hypothetical protein
VVTDHCPLTFFKMQPLLTKRQARWSEFLEEFKYKWEYRLGRTNVADPLSRNPTFVLGGLVRAVAGTSRSNLRGGAGSANCPLAGSAAASSAQASAVAPDGGIFREGEDEPRYAQRGDSLSPSRDDLDENSSTLVKSFREGYQQDAWFAKHENTQALHQRDGLWWYADKIAVPKSMRQLCMQENHDVPYSGHVGVDKTIKNVQSAFWWPTLQRDVTEYVKTCHSCQRNKSSNQKPGGMLRPLSVPLHKWMSASMDFVVQLPRTARGYDAIVVFVDRLSKLTHLAPTTTDCSAAEVAEIFMREVFRHHGMPANLITDRDTRFTSRFWTEVCNLMGMQQAMSSAYHPQTDGQTERVNRVMEDMLRHFVSSEQDDWDRVLPCVEYAINNSYHESIKTTPFQITYGERPRSPLENLLITRNMDQVRCPAAKELAVKMQAAVGRARTAMLEAQQRQKANADGKRRDITFAVGDQVLVSTRNMNLKTPGTKKLMPKYVGPFKVIKKLHDVAYKLALPVEMKGMHDVFHVSLLHPYRTDGRYQPPPPPVQIEGQEEYEVQRILDHRDRKGRKGYEYLIQWTGYGPEYNEWRKHADLQNCRELISEYWNNKKQKAAARELELQQPELVTSARARRKVRRNANRRTMNT